MKKVLGNIGRVIWAPAVFLGMQIIVRDVYRIFLGVMIGLRLGLESMASGVNFDFGDIDLEVLEQMIWAEFNGHVSILISAAGTFLFVFLVMRKRWKEEFFWGADKIKADASPLIIGAGLGIALNLFAVGFLTLLPVEVPEQPFDMLFGENILLMLFTLALIVPIIEEIVYRGIVQKNLLRQTSVPVAIILQAVIFGIVHLNFYQSVYTFVLGIVIGVIYFWYDSIWVPVMIHITFNGTSVILAEIVGESGIDMGLLLVMVGASLLISAGFFSALASRRPKPVPVAAGSALWDMIVENINKTDGEDHSDYDNRDNNKNNNDDDNTPFIG